MAKSESNVINAPFDLDDINLAEIPDEMPLLNEGRWEVQLVSFYTKAYEKSKRGPFTKFIFKLRPVSPVSDLEPVDGYEDMLVEHTMLFYGSTKDAVEMKQMIKAFGGDVNDADLKFKTKDEEGKIIYPALEAIKTNTAHARVFHRDDTYLGKKVVAFAQRDFGLAA